MDLIREFAKLQYKIIATNKKKIGTIDGYNHKN